MADESEKNELIAQFTSVTGTDAQRAQFYLESSGWQLQVSYWKYSLQLYVQTISKNI